MIKIILDYYNSINRDKIPNIQSYSKKELEKVIYIFNLS